MHHLLAPFRLLAAAGVSVALLGALPGPSAAAVPTSAGPVLAAAGSGAAGVHGSGNGHGGGGGGGGGGSTPIGYDISYPQCGRTFPANVLFGIVGVNDGIVYSPNPCLADEVAWAESSLATQAQLYANTADPGPQASSYWPAPNTQAGTQTCAYTDKTSPEANSYGCNYIYGWNAAANSFQTAVNAYASLGYVDPSAKATAAGWWLDVETANSWQTDPVLNVWALQGAVAFLADAGVPARNTGFYSTAAMWQTIAGGDASTFTGYATWVPGARTERAAQRNCVGTGFTGGPIALTQYQSGGYDADYQCSP